MILLTERTRRLALTDKTMSFESRGFKIGKLIGKGTFSKVYEATATEIDKTIALACKVIDKTKAPEDFIAKFLPREIEILPKLAHPHIIRLYAIYKS